MNGPDPQRVLAIGIDAAESTLVRSLIDANQLPALGRLAEHSWRTVHSPAAIGSGAVWPTFFTGTEPTDHGVCAEWTWQPQSMTLRRFGGSGLTPFWDRLVRSGVRVGMLDVPFAPLVSMKEGFEIREWGPHDAFDGQPSAGPDAAADLMKSLAPHPFYTERIDPSGPADIPALEALISTCLRGVRQRGDLLRRLIGAFQPHSVLAAFTEVHHASHYLWQTIAPDDPLYARIDVATSALVASGMTEIHREVDRQIGTIIEAADPDTAVLVFSLHGMRPATGIAAFLGPILIERGFATPAPWRSQSSRERLFSAFAAVKRNSPAPLKKLYYHVIPPTTTRRLAQPTMMPAYDWRETRAFALPSDQHGWIRINLAGREAAGIVPPAAYDATCRELEALLADLKDDAGRRLVTRTVRTALDPGSAMSALPDLVAHWADTALVSPLSIQGSRIVASTIGRKFTSQHALEGFCLWRGRKALASGPVQATELHRLIAS